MSKHNIFRVLPSILAVFAWMACSAHAGGEIKIKQVASGLFSPWAIAPLPDGRLLVTEKSGGLILVDGDDHISVDGVPKVHVQGQGGLLDITLARDFSTSRELFLTYVKKQGGGSGTAVARARLSDDGRELQDVLQLFEMKPGTSGGRHFGARVVESMDGSLFVTLGERGDRPSAQKVDWHNGKIIRINRDGTVPQDNPFVDQIGVLPEIYSLGHRNPQGADFDAQGQLWTVEHGAKGGDEINLIIPKANYGWPVISYGTHYSGEMIGEGTAKDGMKQPKFYWDPSIAPSGLMVYAGDLFPEWRGDIFVGSLKFDHIARLSGDPLHVVQIIRTPETIRVRDIVQTSKGGIFFISEGNGAVYSITP